jgi:hypothetical protein
MAEIQTPPIPVAYNNVGNPQKLYNSTAVARITAGSSLPTCTITINQNGTIQAFLANIGSPAFGSLGGAWDAQVTFRVRKNGEVVHSSSMDIYDYAVGAPARSGSLYYETLNFLSGTDVYAGDVYTLEIERDNFTGAAFVDVEMQLNMLVLNKTSAFY